VTAAMTQVSLPCLFTPVFPVLSTRSTNNSDDTLASFLAQVAGTAAVPVSGARN